MAPAPAPAAAAAPAPVRGGSDVAGPGAAAVVQLAAQPLQRERLAGMALDAVAGRTWERSLQRLADGYRRALDPAAGLADARRAA